MDPFPPSLYNDILHSSNEIVYVQAIAIVHRIALYPREEKQPFCLVYFVKLNAWDRSWCDGFNYGIVRDEWV